MRNSRSVLGFLLIFLLGPTVSISSQHQTDPKVASLYSGVPSSDDTPLPVQKVVENLVRKNEERAEALVHSKVTRVYHLVYQGFFGKREAQMTVEASYDRRSTRKFRILSQSGSKVLLDRVLKRILKSEEAAARPETSTQTQLNFANYDFTLVGYEPAGTGRYVLSVRPRLKNKYVYRGRIWVDGADFGITHLEGEPAQNPSFWTKKVEIHVEYKKVQNFWVPARNESVSLIRLGGRATLTINYIDYELRKAQSRESSERVPIN